MSNIFSRYDIRGRANDSLTTEYVWNVGKALADWLPLDGRVVVVTQPGGSASIVKPLIEGLRLQGRDVTDGGQGDKQTITQVSTAAKAAGAVLVSHDDLQNLEVIELFQENAVSINSENGLTELAELIDAGNFVPAAVKGELTSII